MPNAQHSGGVSKVKDLPHLRRSQVVQRGLNQVRQVVRQVPMARPLRIHVGCWLSVKTLQNSMMTSTVLIQELMIQAMH